MKSLWSIEDQFEMGHIDDSFEMMMNLKVGFNMPTNVAFGLDGPMGPKGPMGPMDPMRPMGSSACARKSSRVCVRLRATIKAKKILFSSQLMMCCADIVYCLM